MILVLAPNISYFNSWKRENRPLSSDPRTHKFITDLNSIRGLVGEYELVRYGPYWLKDDFPEIDKQLEIMLRLGKLKVRS